MSGQLRLRSGDRTSTAVVLSDSVIAVDEVEYTVEPVSHGVYRVSEGERSWLVAVAGGPDDRWVHVNGRVARIEVSSAAAPRRHDRRLVDEAMMAPMPATVVKLLVETGATVQQGDTVLVLEAMKMELPVRAPRAGVVARILCRPGELVQPGVVLVELQ